MYESCPIGALLYTMPSCRTVMQCSTDFALYVKYVYKYVTFSISSFSMNVNTNN